MGASWAPGPGKVEAVLGKGWGVPGEMVRVPGEEVGVLGRGWGHWGRGKGPRKVAGVSGGVLGCR